MARISPPPPNLIASRLRAARVRAGIDVSAVAEVLGRSRNTVAAWESGRSLPNAADLAVLVTLYRCSADWIVGADAAAGFAALIDSRVEALLLQTDSLEDFRTRAARLCTIVHEGLTTVADPGELARRIDAVLARGVELEKGTR